MPEKGAYCCSERGNPFNFKNFMLHLIFNLSVLLKLKFELDGVWENEEKSAIMEKKGV